VIRLLWVLLISTLPCCFYPKLIDLINARLGIRIYVLLGWLPVTVIDVIGLVGLLFRQFVATIRVVYLEVGHFSTKLMINSKHIYIYIYI